MKTAPLGDLCEITVGRTPARANPEFWGPGEPWLTIADMNQGLLITKTKEQITRAGAVGGKQVTRGTVLLSFKLSIGKVAIAGITLYTNEAIAALKVRDTGQLEPTYLLRALEATDLAGGSNRAAMGATLNKAMLHAIRIPMMPLAQQRRIAAILDHADALRAKRRQSLALLDDLTQSVFRDMFGDPSMWPDQWPMGVIADTVSAVNYGSSAKAGSEGDWPILRMGNLTMTGRLELDDLKYVDLTEAEVPKYTVRRGDLLFNRTNSPELVGKTAVVRTDQPLAFAGYLIRVRANEHHNAEFLSGYLNSRHGKAVLRGMNKAIIGQANINAKELQTIPIALPPKRLQDEFSQSVDKINAQRAAVQHSLATLDELFASLQSRAFSGQL